MSNFTEQYDVVVVGAGHAGCEAAMAAARMGLKRTTLISRMKKLGIDPRTMS